MTVFAACALLSIGLLFYVFYFSGEVEVSPVKTRLGYLLERKEVIYENLRDLNFEYKAGKFSDEDYEALRAGLENEAATVLAEIESLRGSEYPV